MRIVHFDQMFHPDFGDQINILPKFQVKIGHEVIIVTGDSSVPHPRFKNFADNSNMNQKDKEFESKTGVKIVRVGIKKFVSGRGIFENGFDKIVDNLNPDILFCHFNDTLVGMHYIKKAHKLNYPLILDSHMLEMASKNKLKNLFRFYYRKFITPKIKKNNIIIIKTQNEDYLNDKLGVPRKLTPYISFGTDTSVFKPNPVKKDLLRNELGISNDDFVVVYTGKLDEEKNGKLLANAFLNKFDTTRKVTLITVGNMKNDYEREVLDIFNLSDNRIINIPTQKYIDLAQYYQCADVSVFPKQSSLSFFDAQACGLPVIAEDNNINVDRLSNGNGVTFKSDNLEDLRKKVSNFIKNEYNYTDMSMNAINYIKENFDYKNLTNEYESIIQSEVEKFHKKMS